MKAALLVLAVIAAAIFLGNRPHSAEERALQAIARDCARLYRPLGAKAERDCQIEMMWYRDLTRSGGPG